jgi:hypothetical protein
MTKRKRTNNTITKRTKGQAMIFKILHRKLKIKQQDSTLKNLIESRCSARVSSSSSITGFCHVTDI